MLQPAPSGAWRTLRRGAVGLALFGVAGWMWRRNAQDDTSSNDPGTGNARGRTP